MGSSAAPQESQVSKLAELAGLAVDHHGVRREGAGLQRGNGHALFFLLLRDIGVFRAEVAVAHLGIADEIGAADIFPVFLGQRAQAEIDDRPEAPVVLGEDGQRVAGPAREGQRLAQRVVDPVLRRLRAAVRDLVAVDELDGQRGGLEAVQALQLRSGGMDFFQGQHVDLSFHLITKANYIIGFFFRQFRKLILYFSFYYVIMQ